jgi:diaminohydroxyphosphoribosylaminopyrimidine deaminase/5-amino-6-(5-phosphoribosylamino)uracil reductase
MSGADDYRYMARALRLAEGGLYTADPNPRVGCVLVKAGEVVGEGWHERAGAPHAEREALAAAGGRARGATAYVTLEPCSHQGRTPPCSTALIEAGVARVVCAARDPNPLVSGAGVRELEGAGTDVEVGVLEQAAEDLNPGYLARMRRARPWVRSKLAASLDGRTALADGESQWITGSPARRDVHRWRARSSVVLTGIGTLLRDDPVLTARLEGAERVRQPVRAVIDPRLQTPVDARLFSAGGDVVLFATRQASSSRRAALEEAGARVEIVAGSERCDLPAVLGRLAELEANEVWVEAGSGLNGALAEAGLIDELIIYLAPQLLGDTARGMFALAPLGRLSERQVLAYRSIRPVGDDLRIVARPSTVAAPAPPR